MNRAILETRKRPQVLVINIESPDECLVKMVGIDYNNEASVYFNRGYGVNEKKFKGIKEFKFPMPLTPDKLLFTTSCGDILSVRSEPIKRGELFLRDDDADFLKMALSFAENAAYLPAGAYEKNGFLIMYNDEIINHATGKAESTPARISRTTGIIEINRKQFIEFSIPMRVVILLHEYMHFRLNTRIEIEADFNALNVFLKYGFTKTEALYAFTKIFYDKKREDLEDRVQKIYDFIESFPEIN